MPEDFTIPFEKKFMKQITAQNRAVSALFDQFSKAVTPLLAKYKKPPIATDVWQLNKDIESAINSELRKLQTGLKDFMNSESMKAWNLSNDKSDAIVNNYIEGLAISDIAKDGLFTRNLEALKAFQQRAINGLGLSDRVWKICEQSKDQLELYMQSGLATGRSAANIAGDVKKYLNNPDARFRRVRDENGKLIMSKPMANYHPGQGVYRSAYKNALRMTQTETNMAYRSADMERWKKIDFVKGYEVKLSNNHPALDICDYLKGEYPKTFFFDGWHPNCYCYCVPILPSQDDFVNYLNTDKLPGSPIKGIPPSAVKYMKDKSGVFNRMKNKPTWLKNNFVSRNGVYYPKAGVDKPPKITGVISESQPIMTPVSNAFSQIPNGISTEIKTALDAINSVHSDGKLPKIKLLIDNEMEMSGVFRYSEFTRIPDSIKIKKLRSTDIEISFIHETGHFLDLSGIGEPGVIASGTSMMDDVIRAIRNSESYRKLQLIKTLYSSDVRLTNYINYLCEHEEQWARAYSQYIAEKSKNAKLLTQVNNLANLHLPNLWKESDFKPIKDEIDKLFTKLGWL
jgi:hypothetical protein